MTSSEVPGYFFLVQVIFYGEILRMIHKHTKHAACIGSAYIKYSPMDDANYKCFH